MDARILKDETFVQQYRINTYWSKSDQAYIAVMPDLSGCLSDGATEAEAKQNILLIAQEWIDTAHLLGRPVPEPAHGKAFA